MFTKLSFIIKPTTKPLTVHSETHNHIKLLHNHNFINYKKSIIIFQVFNDGPSMMGQTDAQIHLYGMGLFKQKMYIVYIKFNINDYGI